MNLDPKNPMSDVQLGTASPHDHIVTAPAHIFRPGKNGGADEVDLQSTVGVESWRALAKEKPRPPPPREQTPLEVELGRQVAALEERRADAVNLISSLSEAFQKDTKLCAALELVRAVVQGEG